MLFVSFSDPQKIANESFGPRVVGGDLPCEGRSRHHPDGLRQLQERDERDQKVRNSHGLLRQSRELPGIEIGKEKRLKLKTEFNVYKLFNKWQMSSFASLRQLQY